MADEGWQGPRLPSWPHTAALAAGGTEEPLPLQPQPQMNTMPCGDLWVCKHIKLERIIYIYFNLSFVEQALIF